MTATVMIVRRPIQVRKILESVMCPACGGIVSFIGTVREESAGMRVTQVELEAAEDLARKDLMRIARMAVKKFGAKEVSICHRIGRLGVGDVIVVIAVSSAHRKEAFKACEFIIDALKKSTPIWKREFSGQKRRWIQGSS